LVHEDRERAKRESKTVERDRGESERRERKKKKTPKREMRVREERTKKKKRIDDLREEAVARDEKLKREARVFFFPFYMLMRVSVRRVGYLQGKNLYTCNPPCPARVG
jgi:hypothetical protein